MSGPSHLHFGKHCTLITQMINIRSKSQHTWVVILILLPSLTQRVMLDLCVPDTTQAFIKIQVERREEKVSGVSAVTLFARFSWQILLMCPEHPPSS